MSFKNTVKKMNVGRVAKNAVSSVSKATKGLGGKVAKMTKSKYFLYTMLFLAISTVLGFLSMQNYRAVVLFVVVAFAMHHFTKNMGVVLLTAIIVSNIISVKSTIEGMSGDDAEKAKSYGKNMSKGNKNKKSNGGDDAEDDTENDAKDDAEDDAGDDAEDDTEKTGEEGMAPIDYKMGDDVDDDVINRKSTQQAAYSNLNKIIGGAGFEKMTKDTEELIKQQNNLAKAMNSMTPLIQNAEKMMSGLNLDKFSGMIDKLSGGVTGAGKKPIKGAQA